jgi:hypothetical protein
VYINKLVQLQISFFEVVSVSVYVHTLGYLKLIVFFLVTSIRQKRILNHNSLHKKEQITFKISDSISKYEVILNSSPILTVKSLVTQHGVSNEDLHNSNLSPSNYGIKKK